MSITYPIYLPGLNLPEAGVVLPITSIRFKPRSVVAMSASPFTLQQQVQVHQGQIWAAEIKLPRLRGAEAQEWIAALLSLNGIQGTFYLGDPALRAPRGVPTGTPVVDGADQAGQSLSIKGLTPDSEDNFLQGDWIQVGTGLIQRIYRVLNPVDADGSGNAIIDIWPRLRESPGDEEEIIFEDTMGVFSLPNNEMPWDIDQSLFYGFEFEAIEAIRNP